MKYSRILFRLMLLVMVLTLIIPSLCHAWSGEVVYVVDGDTFDVERDGKKVRVRLYGVDTPERSQWYGQNAKTFTSSQVMGKMVEVQETGRAAWDRAEGIVMIGNLNINRHIVEYGYAWVDPRYCKKTFCSEWSDLEAEAKTAKRGLWKNAKAIPPWDYRRSKRKKSSSPRPKQAVDSGSGCDCTGNRYNCSDFKTQTQAQECYDHCRRVKSQDVHKLDRDKDGRGCESLP